MTHTRQRTVATVSWTLLALMMLLTSPVHMPVSLLIIPFAILFIALYATLGLLLSKYSKQPSQRVRRLSTAIAAIIVIAAALQSLGQLTARDVIVALALILIGYFYIGRTAVNRS